jgi:hypothetical protein
MAPRSGSTHRRLLSVSILAGGVLVAAAAYGSISQREDDADSAVVARRLAGPRFPTFMPEHGSTSVRVVSFIDVQCEGCAKLIPAYLQTIEEKQRVTGVRIDFQLRHYPLDAACNPLMPGSSASAGCALAQVVEAVRERDGAPAALDAALMLMASPGLRSAHVSVSGFDQAWLDQHSVRLLSRVREDIAAGIAHGVLATPTLFVNGIRLRSPDQKMFDRILDAVIHTR